MRDIIAAIATGHSPCAIGILRLSGPDCARVAGQVFTPDNGKSLWEIPPHKMVIGTVRDRQGRVIDQALAVRCIAPRSYTGEDTVELQCHGSPAMLAAALEALFAAGARQAGPGEFTKRAFLNGQLDLTQAEAVIDLIHAETADAAANAAGQLGGTLLKKIQPVYSALTDLCSHFHAVLDYPDEDIEDFRISEFSAVLDASKRDLDALFATYEHGKHLKQGIKTVLLGRPNAGKSSLFNALAGYDRVIVTEIPGTTRDTVEETVTVGKVLLRLIDTAGIREASDRIEAMGVERSQAAAESAELAIFVCDGSQPLNEEDRRAIEVARKAPASIAILNKSDLGCVVDIKELPFENILSLSAQTGKNLHALHTFLEDRYGRELHCDGSLLTNARQFGAIHSAVQAIDRARSSLLLGLTPDAVLTDVEDAMSALGEVTGTTVREDITNRIFERFCVGK